MSNERLIQNEPEDLDKDFIINQLKQRINFLMKLFSKYFNFDGVKNNDFNPLCDSEFLISYANKEFNEPRCLSELTRDELMKLLFEIEHILFT